MKKILVMVLCLIMAAMPVMAEEATEPAVKDYKYMYAEPRDSLFAELGVEPATDADVITPAGDGWYVVSARNEKRLDVYSPDDGWKSVDFSALSEEAYEQFRGMMSSAVKNDHYIYLFGNGGLYIYIIDLTEYKLIDEPLISEHRVDLTSEGYLYSVINENGRTTIEFKGFREGWDISALGADALVYAAELTRDGLVVVYAKENGNLHGAWLSRDGIIQDTYLFPSVYVGTLIYSDTTHTLIYNHGGYNNVSRMAIANMNGDTKVVFCDYEEDLQGNLILGTESEYVVVDAESVVYAEGGVPETIDGNSTAREVYIDIAPVALVDNDRFLLVVSANNYTACMMDLVTGEMVELDMDKEERKELFDIGRDRYNRHWTTGEIIPHRSIDFKLVK